MRFLLETLGCKVNQYETQAIATMLRERGHVPAEPGGECDVVVVNTCAVTGESSRKSRQAVRRLKNAHPQAIIAVSGCLSQISPDEIAALGADYVSGSGGKQELVAELERMFDSGAKSGDTATVSVDDPFQRRVFEPLPSGGVNGRTRAMLKIQDGCDNFCSYCVIPYARGHVRSLPPALVAEESIRLHRDGYREIVVTGIEISSYGRDLDGVTLLDALTTVSDNAPDSRIHLSSLEPGSITDELCRGLAELPRLCDHFHLSLQSGCDETLRRMRRRYTTADFRSAVDSLRAHFPNCGISADLITGFPGETDREFNETMAFIESCAFSSMHVFPYSERPGTPAAVMENQVPPQVRRDRAATARASAAKMRESFEDAQIGKTHEVLFEREKNGVSVGHTGNYVEIAVTATGVRGERRAVRVTSRGAGEIAGN